MTHHIVCQNCGKYIYRYFMMNIKYEVTASDNDNTAKLKPENLQTPLQYKYNIHPFKKIYSLV